MDSNTYSTHSPGGFGALVAELDRLAAQDPDRLPDGVRAERVLVLRRLLDRLEGHWLKELAAVDACGTAGADQGTQAASTASWLRNRLHVGAGAAASAVRTARALFRGPLPATAAALTAGELSPAHASVLAAGTHDLPAHLTAEAEPVLLEAARRLDPPRLRRVLGHLRLVADPDNEQDRTAQRHGRRGVWLTPTWDGMVAVDGLLETEAGQIVLAALEPLARPADAQDTRSGGQRTADALTELARRQLEGGRLPQTGRVRPQLLVTVDLDSLLGRPGAVGGDTGASGPLDPEACRRLACDSAVTRVLATRHPTSLTNPTVPGGPTDPTGNGRPATPTPGEDKRLATRDASDIEPLAARLRAAMTLLPRCWAGRPPSRWRSGGSPGSSSPPNGPPWSSATAAVSSRTVTGPWPGARPTIWSTGWMAAPPTCPTWPCSAEPITGRSTRAAGVSTATPMAGSPPPRHPTEDTPTQDTRIEDPTP